MDLEVARKPLRATKWQIVQRTEGFVLLRRGPDRWDEAAGPFADLEGAEAHAREIDRRERIARCKAKRHRDPDMRRLAYARERARLAGNPADLALDVWRVIVARYHSLCAYCLTRPYETIEHVVPVRAGGGTTAANCVPACKVCQRLADWAYDHGARMSPQAPPGAL